MTGHATIFMLHRVHAAEPGRLPANEGLKIDPRRLETFLVQARARGHVFVSLDQLYAALQERRSIARMMALTLDDGYADNYTQAWPLFQKHQVPFAVYVSTSFPERQALLWWHLLEELVLARERVVLADGTVHTTATAHQKQQVFMQLRARLMGCASADLPAMLRLVFGNDASSWLEPVERLALSWQQIEHMSRDPLVTIGAHGVSHRALSTLAPEVARAEVDGSRALLEQHINRAVHHFCYPFGGAAEAAEPEFALLAARGFRTATTTREGPVLPAHREHATALPRFMLGNDFSWLRFRLRTARRLLQARGHLS